MTDPIFKEGDIVMDPHGHKCEIIAVFPSRFPGRTHHRYSYWIRDLGIETGSYEPALKLWSPLHLLAEQAE